MGECMFIFRLLRRLVLIICIILGAIYAYDAYQSYQGTNRVSKAHTTVEQTIEKNEDTLSRWERIYRMLTFKEKVEIALYQRVSKDTWVKSDVIPDNAKRALIAIEDKRYYKHGAIDVLGVSRALYVNAVAGETVEGGSTITQQLVKNLFLSSKRIMSRKVEEVFLAYLMEHYYSKDEIITMYLNTIYYGTDYYGIKAASEGYFKTEPKDLNLSQAAVLAGIPQAPSYFNPVSNIDATKQRQRTVLTLMAQQGIISYADIDKAYYKRLDAPKKQENH